MISISDLPGLNAILNSASMILLIMGYICIRRKLVAAHRACMLGAFFVSTLFLVSYLTYHYHFGSKSFTHQGWVRPLYFTVLISHVILAALIIPLAVITIYRAVSGRIAQHQRIARWTLPIWLYVSLTGVIVYLMLYQMN